MDKRCLRWTVCVILQTALAIDVSDVCKLPVKVGPCKALLIRYYYDDELGRCETFTYGGCEGNGNNFETVEHCERTCATNKWSADCRGQGGCEPCHDCLPDRERCALNGESCEHYSCQTRCGKCQECAEDECHDVMPRWCTLFKPCQVRRCNKYPKAACQERDCDCFNVHFLLANGTKIEQKDC